MTWDRIAGNWKLFRGKIRKQWGKLTKDDIAAANGRREELAGRIRARYGVDKAQADSQVDAWMKAQK
ncbi:MAG: CsbD family protein [Pseudorhodoplanes sp.]|nr:CsbD family protein [Pseudorhodoplanes sp.]